MAHKPTRPLPIQDAGTGPPGSAPSLQAPDPPAPPPPVSKDDEIAVFGADIVVETRRTFTFTLDPHMLYKTLVVASATGLWYRDGNPPLEVVGMMPGKDALWVAFKGAQGTNNLFKMVIEAVSQDSFIPTLLTGLGVAAAGASLLATDNNRYQWVKKLVGPRAFDSDDEDIMTLYSPAEEVIIEAIHTGSLEPIKRYVSLQGAASIYSKRNRTDRR